VNILDTKLLCLLNNPGNYITPGSSVRHLRFEADSKHTYSLYGFGGMWTTLFTLKEKPKREIFIYGALYK